uniref:Uncharacterized protein n=1 Tax=Sphaerodactylus townsendi TaxID=933632 RepID=A0ACB8FP45_9SAUR
MAGHAIADQAQISTIETSVIKMVATAHDLNTLGQLEWVKEIVPLQMAEVLLVTECQVPSKNPDAYVTYQK